MVFYENDNFAFRRSVASHTEILLTRRRLFVRRCCQAGLPAQKLGLTRPLVTFRLLFEVVGLFP
jgi:hypothetical protein